MDSHDRYVVVAKLGVGGQEAIKLDPRRQDGDDSGTVLIEVRGATLGTPPLSVRRTRSGELPEESQGCGTLDPSAMAERTCGLTS